MTALAVHSTPDTRRPVDDGLRRSVLAPVLLLAYRALSGHRRRKVAGAVAGLLQRLEGGAVRSASMRKVMSDWGVEIGAYSYGACFEPGAWPPGVVVGRYTSVAQGVRVFNQNHPLGWLSTHPFFYDPRLGVCRDNPLHRHTLHIGHDVWLGQNAIITPGCRRIGNGAVVGAGAVVTKDVEPFAIVAGNPARVLRKRFD
ncbi:MAG: hypothetical protein AAF656_07540, partial [Planctomycetota bacterium]